MQVKYLRASKFGFLDPEIRKLFLSQGMLPVVINDAYIPHLFRPERLQLWYGGSGCFVPGTLVRTETGLRAIESIRIGERVLSFDTDKRQPEYMPVLKTFRFSAVDIKQKFVTFVLPTYKIVCTANHEFYINGTWIAAGIIAERIMATNTEYRRRYYISNKGRLLTTKHYARSFCNRYKAAIMKPSKNSDGYPSTMISINQRSVSVKIHRLVALAWIENPLGLPVVNHKDLDKTNNFVENLEWVTARENSDHFQRSGLQPLFKGEASTSSKLKEWQVLEIRAFAKTKKKGHRSILSEKFGVSEATIKDVVLRNSWKHVP